MADIEILQINNKDYISFQNTARYLGCDEKQVTDYVYLDKLRAGQVESRWLLEWESVKAFATKRGQKHRAG